MRRSVISCGLAGLVAALAVGWSATPGTSDAGAKPECADNAIICAEVSHPVGYAGAYTGHDEPSTLFYSATPGTGNAMTYQLTLPRDPSTLPTQDGRGGTFNFQLHPAFWFGMAMCDDQSSPNPGGSPVGPQVLCKPASDDNIYNSSDPTSPRYIGRHPGTAFMELQFYPPGWAPLLGGTSCDATHWCAALNIDSFSSNDNTGQALNASCQKIVGQEYVNFAYVTKTGVPQAPPNPVEATAATYSPDTSRELLMNPGDQVTVDLRDSAHGLVATLTDLTTGGTGTMTASASNGFGEVQFAPTGKSCTNIPYDFHPMYSTSSENTRVPWTAHSYNIAFSDEIGHFELCDKVAPGSATCAQSGVSETGGKDADDDLCFDASQSFSIQLSGCTDTDVDFDGASYQASWPGTIANPTRDAQLHPTPIMFTSPVSNGNHYERMGFETDMPRIEDQTNPPCQRHVSNPSDPSPGSGCVNPPPGAQFYPIYSTTNVAGRCTWQLGGPSIPGSTNTFGGDSVSEFGTTLLPLFYPSANGQPQVIDEDFRTIISNPCS